MDRELAESLAVTEPWQWPSDIAHKFRAVLRDRQAEPAVRLIVADIAGETPDMTPGLASTLLDVAADNSETEELRAKAAIALGPTLELVNWALGDPEDMPVPDKTYVKIARTLERIYANPNDPKLVRRRVLEAAVRGPLEDWHEEAVRTAYASEDIEWKVTAVFCMDYVKGFDQAILESLQSPDEDVLFHALQAAGTWELDAAWPTLLRIAQDESADKKLRMEAMAGLSYVRPAESLEILDGLQAHSDSELAEAAEAAWSEANYRIANPPDDEDLDEEDDDLFGDGEDDEEGEDGEDDEVGEDEPGPPESDKPRPAE
ncbi:MAG: hypothetical protein ABI759_15420 [Candidatus Solibacter sp.]